MLSNYCLILLEDEWSGTDKMLSRVREGAPVFITPLMVLDSSNHVLRCRMGIGIETEGGMKMKKAKSTYTVS